MKLAYGEDSPVLKNKQVRCDMRSSCAWVALGAPCTMQAGTGLANGEGSPVLGSNQVQMGYGWRLGSCASQQARGVNRPALLKRRMPLAQKMHALAATAPAGGHAAEPERHRQLQVCAPSLCAAALACASLSSNLSVRQAVEI